jgi:hypothetical protein
MRFNSQFRVLAASLLVRGVLTQNATNSTYDPLQYVNQLIGSSNGGSITHALWLFSSLSFIGNIFPGATLPYGKDLVQNNMQMLTQNKEWRKLWPTQILAQTKAASLQTEAISPGFPVCTTLELEDLHP